MISTRMVAGGSNPALSSTPSTGNSGPISLNAPSITLGPGTQLLAWANAGYTPGNISIIASTTVDGSLGETLNNEVDPLKQYDVDSGVQIDDATLDGGNVDVSANASTYTFAEYDVYGPSLSTLVIDELVAQMSNPTVTTLTFTNASGGAPSTISRSVGDWISDGFAVGQEIQAVGSQSNDGEVYTIAGISPQTLDLAPGEYLTDETDTDTASVQQVVSSLLPQNLPTVAFDSSGNEVSAPGSATPVTSTALADFEELAQQVELLGAFPVFDGVISHATSSVELLGASSINASGDVDIESDSTADAQIDTPSYILGGAYADSEGYATTTLGDGVTIDAGGTFTLGSTVENTMTANIDIEGGLVDPNATFLANGAEKLGGQYGLKIPGPALDVAYGVGVSDASTSLDSGASVQAAQVKICSNVTNFFDTTAASAVTAPGLQNPATNQGNADYQGQAVSVAISNLTSSSSTQVDGTVIAGTGAAITANANNEMNITYANAKVRNEPISEQYAPAKYINSIEDLEDVYQLKDLSSENGLRQSTGHLGIAAGITYVQSSNLASASIGPTGIVSSQGSLTENATATDAFAAAAIGAALTQSTVALGGALVIANESNQAFATIESTGGVNASGALSVTADATIPLLHSAETQLENIPQFFANAFAPSQTQSSQPGVPSNLSDPDSLDSIEALLSQLELGASLLGDISNYTNAETGLPTSVATTFVGAANESGQAKTQTNGSQNEGVLGVSGSVDLFSANNEAEAWIGPDAKVNVDSPSASDQQSVSVTASASSTRD